MTDGFERMVFDSGWRMTDGFERIGETGKALASPTWIEKEPERRSSAFCGGNYLSKASQSLPVRESRGPP